MAYHKDQSSPLRPCLPSQHFPIQQKRERWLRLPSYGGYGYYDYPYTYGYAPWAYGNYYPKGYWHPPGGYYYPRAYRRQYNRPFYRGYW